MERKLLFVGNTKEDIMTAALHLFAYWIEDDFASSFRKMLTLEQFRNEEMQRLHQQYLVSGSAEYVNDLFENMGIEDPKGSAVAFYANLFFYYSVYDGAEDKEKVKEQFQQVLTKIGEEIKYKEKE